MAEKKNTEPENHKSIDELAREAMEAIKASEKKQEKRLEEEAAAHLKAKEDALKEEVKRKLKRKMERLKKEEEKKPVVEEDTRFMVTWKNPDGNGYKYIGEYNEKEVFRINRGMNLFHLQVTGKKIYLSESWRKNAHTSIYLDNLKEKADKILKESNKIHKRIKEQEKNHPKK